MLKVKAADEMKRKELEEKEAKKEEEEKDIVGDNEKDDPYTIKLEELLDDLKLEDDPVAMKENEEIVEDFIKKMDEIKISKE